MGLQTIKPHRSAYSYLAHDAAYYCICSVVYLCVSVCVCLSVVTSVSSAETDEPIEMPFGT